jgi:tetratricopeptide (TPR) repeat protein
MTGGYGQFYQPHADKQFPPTEHVQLFQYSKEALDNLAQNGYLVIGSSSFNGPDQSNYTAINQAKKVGADIVLLNSKYTGTAHGSLSLPEYHAPQTTTVTTHESGHINIYGAGGSAHGNFSGSSNSYITSPGYTTYKNVPFSIDRYDHLAVFLRKERDENNNQINGGTSEALEWLKKSTKNLQQKEWAEAIRTSSAAITLDQNYADAYVNRAWAYCEKGLYEKALEDANKAIAINPKNAAALNNRGLAYDKMEQNDKAIQDYRVACELGLESSCRNFKRLVGYLPSEEVNFYQKQGIDYFSSGDYDNVIIVTGKVIEIDPKNAEAYSTRCAAKANKSLLDEAKEDCKKSIECNPDFSMAYNNLGYVLELEGVKNEAIIYYEMSCCMGLKLGCDNQQRLSSAE